MGDSAILVAARKPICYRKCGHGFELSEDISRPAIGRQSEGRERGVHPNRPDTSV